MKTYEPDRNGLATLRLLILLASAVLIGAVWYFIPVKMIVIIMAAAVGTVAIFSMFVYFPLYFRSLSYDSTDREIIKHSGVFIKSHQSVLYSTVQYTTVVTTPFARHTGFNFVIFFVYGGQLRLLFLRYDDAMEILGRTSLHDPPEGGQSDVP
ncbi:MAG: PH domain-containing protein [Ruminococcus sp.]|nr:PH domain-containing protein [Ruminococcus sp.]